MEKRTKRKNFLSSFLAILVMAVMLIGSMAQAVFADDYVAGKTGNINLTIQETGEDGTVKPIPNVNLTLYKVGSVTFDRNVHFVVDSALQFTGIDFENLKTADFDVMYSAHDRCAIPKEYLSHMMLLLKNEVPQTKNVVDLPGIGEMKCFFHGDIRTLDYFDIAFMEEPIKDISKIRLNVQ